MHWTYVEQFDAASDLEQGDILVPTLELRSLLREVHRYFDDDKYLAFTVATQSCDLVRRGAKRQPKARYINIAAVRSLVAVAPRLLEDALHPLAPGLFRESAKGEARAFLERLFDQNEQTLGLFYLHPEAAIGVGDPSVVFLRVKVALRAAHYDLLVRARRGRLDPEFRAKFGWLLGNLYSRAANPDWGDFEGGAQRVDALVSTCLEEQIAGAGPYWVDDALADGGQANNVDFTNADRKALLEELDRYRPKPAVEQLKEEVLKDGAKSLGVRRPEETKLDAAKAHAVERLHALKVEQSAAELIVNELAGSIVSAIHISDDRLKAFANRLSNNGVVRDLLKK